MNKQVLERLIKEYKGDDLAGYVSGLIAEEERITKKMILFHEEALKVRKEQASENKRLRKMLGDIRDSCPHHDVSYHADPSGGNDSYMECNVCGKEL